MLIIKPKTIIILVDNESGRNGKLGTLPKSPVFRYFTSPKRPLEPPELDLWA